MKSMGITLSDSTSGFAYVQSRKVRQWCLSALLLVTPVALLAGDFLYDTVDSGLRITGYTGPGNAVDIPNTLDGQPVAVIGENAFAYCTSLTSVTIPDSVVRIEAWAFYECTYLETVTLGNALAGIGDGAFEHCMSLTSVTIPDSVVNVGDGAFQCCTRLEKVTVGNGVTFIDSCAFAYCPNLTRAIFSGNAPMIGWEIFLDSSAVTVYCMPETTGWGDSFSGQPTVRLCDFTYTYEIVGWEYICTITGYTGNGGAVTIPSAINGVTVRKIGDNAFATCTNLTSVIVPTRVVHISPYAFQGCVRLESVTLCTPRCIELGMGVFAGCTALTEVVFFGNAPQTVDVGIFEGSPLVTVYCQSRRAGWGTTLAGRPIERLPFNYSLSLRGEATFYGFGSVLTGSVTVPQNAGRYPVTGIGGQAFLNCAGLTRITLPVTITRIGIGAFSGCSGLEEIVLPESVTEIERYVFSGCTGLKRAVLGPGVRRVGVGAFSGCASLAGITLPAQVGRVEEQTFDQCSGLTEVVFGGSAVTNIGSGAFSGCKGLTHFALPASVTAVGSWAFSECFGLTGITIPAAVTDIGAWAFSGCVRLSAITVEPANATYSSQDGVLFNKDMTTLIRCPGGKSGPYAIPPGTVTLADEAFLGCYALSRIDLPASVTSLGTYVFEGCSSLAAIEVDAANGDFASQEGVLFSSGLPKALLRYPPGKTGVSFAVPSGVAGIGDGAFEGCSSLTDIMLPAEVNAIGKDVFEGCDALTAIQVDTNNAVYASQDGVLLTADRIIIRCPPGKAGDYTAPSGVWMIDNCAFSNCRRLTRITLPASLRWIGSFYYGSPDVSVFAGCSELKAINVDPGGNFFSDDGVLIEYYGGERLIYCPGGKTGEYTVPAGVQAIEFDAFMDCTRLTAINVAAGYGPFSSDDGVLYDRLKTTLLQCPGGKTGHYTVPAPVQRIEAAAFLNCASLTGVAIPAAVTDIEPMAFFGCTSLSAITVDPSNTVYASQGGVLFDKAQHRLLQYPCGKAENSYTVPAGVSSLGDYAFWGGAGLASVYFKGDQPSGVGDGVFIGADQATVYYLPGTSGWGAPLFAGRPAELLPYFYSVSGAGISLSAYAGPGGPVRIPPFIEGKPVTELEDYAFFNCVSLTSVVIPEGVVSIGRSAFENCTGLTRAVIPNSVSDIGDSAFENCTGLTDIVIPDGVTRIGDGSFFNCSSLAHVVIPDSVTSIGGWAFAACDGLESLTLPGSVSQIGNYAFRYCPGLSGVYCKGDAPRFGWSVFDGSGQAAVYYLPGTSGWNLPLSGVNPVIWNPRVQAGAGFGASSSGLFGFTVLGTNGMCVAVEASTNLTAAAWEPVGRVTLAPAGTAAFTDAASGNHAKRFYRFRMP